MSQWEGIRLHGDGSIGSDQVKDGGKPLSIFTVSYRRVISMDR